MVRKERQRPKPSPKKAPPSLRDLSRRIPNSADAQEMFNEIAVGSDHTAAIMATNIIDALLKRYILCSLPRRYEPDAVEGLFEDNGALSTLSARISIAYAMGLVSKKVKDDLNTIRRIRNAFAHAAVPVKFTQPEIARETRKLKDWPAAMSAKDLLKSFHKLPDNKEPSDERLAFYANCNAIFCFMILKEMDLIKPKDYEEIEAVKNLRVLMKDYDKDIP